MTLADVSGVPGGAGLGWHGLFLDALPAGHGVAWDSPVTVLQDCRLPLALQRPGRASAWTPSSEHSPDWLGEALRLAEWLDS